MFEKIVSKIGVFGVKLILLLLMAATLPGIFLFPSAGLFLDIIDIGILIVLIKLT